MSISSRITEMEEHIRNAYDKIEDLGIDTTNINKNINNISSILETVWNEQPKVLGQGTDIVLKNTRKGKMKLDTNGNTEQEQLSGKNKAIPLNTAISKQGITITFNADGSFSVKGTLTGALSEAITKPIDYSSFLGKAMTLSRGYTTTDTVGAIVSVFEDKDGNNIGGNVFNINTANAVTKTINNTDYDISNGIYLVCKLYFPASAIGQTVNITGKLQLEESSTATSYERYCGGIPSPNSQFPQQIKNVTGNANVKIQNKNLFVAQKIVDDSNNSSVYLTEDGFIRYATSSNRLIIKPSFIKENTACTFKLIAKSGSSSQNAINFSAFYTDGTNETIYTTTRNNTEEFTIFFTTNTNKTLDYIRSAWSTSLEAFIKIEGSMILEGSYTAETMPSYVEHQEQNFPLTLGDIELNKIGTAQDYFYKKNGKWYKHEELSSVVFDGTENWANYGSSYDGRFYCTTKHFGDDVGFLNSSKFKCTHFTPSDGTTIVNGIAGTKYATYIKPNIDGVVDATTFKTWLSTHNVTVKCPLVAATNTEITDTTLIEQLNNIQNARSYDDMTIITSESDELGFNMNAVGLEKSVNQVLGGSY